MMMKFIMKNRELHIYKSCVKLFLHQRDTVQIIREFRNSSESSSRVGYKEIARVKIDLEKCTENFLGKV